MVRDRKFSDEELFEVSTNLLLKYKYAGFTFSLLAENLQASRGTIYKKYKNKDDLICDVIHLELERYLKKLNQMSQFHEFDEQLDYFINLMLKNTRINQLMDISVEILQNPDLLDQDKREKLEQMIGKINKEIQYFIEHGKKVGKLKAYIPDLLLINLITRSITIPNVFGVSEKEWKQIITDILCNGILA